jgi:uncharacterized protein (TIGR00297 family)
MTLDDLLITTGAISFVGLVLGLAEVSSRAGLIGPESSRMTVHAVVGLAAASLPFIFNDPTPFFPAAVLAMVVTSLDAHRGRLRSVHGVSRQTKGTPTFAAAFILAGVLCWTTRPDLTYAFTASLAVLAISDPLAALVGHAGRGWTNTERPKTARGSAAFFASAVVIVSVVLFVTQVAIELSLSYKVLVILLTALCATAAEYVSEGGWDNPAIVVAVCATLALTTSSVVDPGIVLVGIVLPAAFAYGTYRMTLLDARGSLVAGLLGTTIVLSNDLRWLFPGLVFFVTSSALSRVGRDRKRDAERRQQKGHVRDFSQVLANGGIAWVLLLGSAFVGLDFLFWGYAGAFAAAAADTWGTEIGTLSRSDPVNIRTLRRAPAGTSGAVTALGTVGAVGGATVIAVLAAPFVSGGGMASLMSVAIFVAAGVVGSSIDTILGATLQALYVDDAGALTERPEGNRLIRGFSWLTNDRVNLAATGTGAVLAILGYGAFV